MNLRNINRAVASIAMLATGLLFTAQAALPHARVTARASSKRLIAHKKFALVNSRHGLHRNLAAGRTRAGVVRTYTGRSLHIAGSRGRRGHSHIFANPWTEPTYADSTIGDSIEGDDLVIRKAAADALGPYNGTIVVADPQSGRILSIINQKLGLKGAFQPCSTVKMVVSLASLREGIVDASTRVQLSRWSSLDMTSALARSNNHYFAKMGEELGFDRVQKYARLFGLGEKAGFDIPGEEAGYVASQPPPTGVGMMTSFGDGIRLTPLELTSIVSSIANGGTMYYLQYPKNQTEAEHFVPRIKRQLDIARYLPEIRPGMIGAVEYGTAKRAVFDQNDPVLGKTGTCTDTAQPGVHLGWFGSYNEVGKNKIVVVVLLTGGRGVAGPIAAGVAGTVYRNLAAQNYFGSDSGTVPTKLVSMQNCCRQ